MRFPIRKVIEFAMTRPDEVDKAYRDFFDDLPFTELEKEWEELFLEWLIYDYKRKNGPAFIIEYALKNPNNHSEDEISQFEQIAETHFYSNFEILEIKRGKWLELEDLFTGNKYKVYDKSGSESLSGRGQIPGRLAKIHSRWYLVGANSVFFPITHTARAKKHMRDLSPKNFSPRDTVELLRQHSQGQDITRPPVLTKKELKAKRKKLKKKYEKCAKKYKATLSFENLLKEINNEDRVNVIDFWQGLKPKGLPEDFFFNQPQLLGDIWNHFPHKCLDEKSPIEKIADL
jgi:hypothetical protein